MLAGVASHDPGVLWSAFHVLWLSVCEQVAEPAGSKGC
jgi:hypothetical protein